MTAWAIQCRTPVAAATRRTASKQPWLRPNARRRQCQGAPTQFRTPGTIPNIARARAESGLRGIGHHRSSCSYLLAADRPGVGRAAGRPILLALGVVGILTRRPAFERRLLGFSAPIQPLGLSFRLWPNRSKIR